MIDFRVKMIRSAGKYNSFLPVFTSKLQYKFSLVFYIVLKLFSSFRPSITAFLTSPMLTPFDLSS